MIRIVLILNLLFFSCVCNSQSLVDRKELYKKIDKYLTKGTENGFSGAVLVAQEGNIILNKGYGLANKELDLLNSPQTIFSTGSVTKQFTATAILKLVALGKLKLNDSLQLFFKELPKDKENITIHQLLTHSAGFLDVIGNGDFDHIPTSEFFKQLFDTELRYTPGTKHQYSNASYSILARIIEIVSELPYEHFLQEYLFKPAGMLQTGYLIPAWKSANLAQGYHKGITYWRSMVTRFKEDGKVSWVLKGNGGIQSTQEDMFKWYKALKSNKILDVKHTKLLITPYIQEQEGSDESHYAYGWAIFKSKRNTKMITHNGSNGIFFHEFMWLPKEDVVIIFSTNAYSREVEILWKLKEMLFNKSYTPKPIQNSPYTLVMKFIKSNSPKQIKELLTLIRDEFGTRFNNVNVLNKIGYTLLAGEQYRDWVVPLFEMNTQMFPKNANIWDSLGDGYTAMRDTENAIKAYQKALEIDPTISSSIESLGKLGINVKQQTKSPIKISNIIMESYLGIYQLSSGHSINITRKEDSLFIEFPGRTAMKLSPIVSNKFSIGNRNATLTFNKNETEKIISFTINEGGEEMIASKK
ncbi:Serine hydrolase [Tenacibaculum sp. 190130A14a]|uniref:Serine hydrolase n=1 Tax=Tenacibaculum polynesiense TaxID=3137857 RepID=A0ABP1F3I2_9FLAO